MNRVLKLWVGVQKSMDVDAVHDLRVGLRRCRAVAETMLEVDAHPDWRTLKRKSRGVFQALGALRDVQILKERVVKLTSADDSIRRVCLDTLEERESELRDTARRSMDEFDQPAWRRLGRRLSRRARFVRANGATAQCLALERLLNLFESHARAVPTETPERWHELRIALKRFRYVVEHFMPAQYLVWESSIKQVQDVLGTLHDLYVLRAFVAREVATGGAGPDEGAIESLTRTIDDERQQCMVRYRERVHGQTGLLREWEAGLPQGKRVGVVTAARLRTTAQALDPRFGRTVLISKLALQLFDMVAARREPGLREAGTRVIFGTAARLQGIRGGDSRGARQKVAYKILRGLPEPIGWTADEWETVACTIRYCRGAEPSPADAAVARLSPERQHTVSVLAGVLRLARALYRSGGTTLEPIRRSDATGELRLQVAGLKDSRKIAGRLASAKHLLETGIGTHVIIDSRWGPGTAVRNAV
jgi:CHAD domain-containing protein